MSGILKAYEEYKKINLPWLHEIPSHWELTRNKNVMKLNKDVVGKNHVNYTLLSLTKQGIIPRDLDNAKGKFPKEFDSYQVVSPLDMVFCLFDIDETPRTVGLSSLEGMITGAYTVFKPQNINEKYLYYYYLALDNNKMLKPLYTGLRKVINTDTFLRTYMPYPSIEEQDKIVKYLNINLSKINKLIKAKKKQSTLLKEKKRAIINNAVTKGIKQNVKMKSSGVEWLGEVPENWQVKPLKYFVKSNVETLTDSVNKEKQITYIDISTVGFGELKQEPVKYKFKDAPSRARRVIHEGDTIISTVRTYLKSMTYIDRTLDGYIASTGFAVLTPNGNVFPRLLNYILSADNFLNRVSQGSIGVSYPAISETKLVALKVAMPDDLDEQKEILEYIKSKTSIIDNTISKIIKEIQLIEEYKTALISAVVTGKVDVRTIQIDEEIEAVEIEEVDEVEFNEFEVEGDE